MKFICKKLYNGSRWLNNALIETDNQGTITTIAEDTIDSNVGQIDGWTFPGFQNCHSHAFQYAMAGGTEYIDPKNSSDDFWTWRKRMYELANSILPEQLKTIATALYSEMRRCGYTWVTEFHYLHHDKNGEHFSDLSTMGQVLLNAAEEVGLGITLVPVFYQRGGFNKDIEAHQKRFYSSDSDSYLRLIEATIPHCNSPYKKLGIGFHSLRAVDKESISEVLKSYNSDPVIHIHIAEQIREVEDCLEALKSRPVQWLLDNFSVSEHWNLVHSTHLTGEEIKGLANSNCQVVLCPSTEGNLGDGQFPFAQYLKAGGRWCIGSDSHININPMEELRWLDYQVRLEQRVRNPLCTDNPKNSGKILIDQSRSGGLRSCGRKVQDFAQGLQLDLLNVGDENFQLQRQSKDQYLSTLVFALNPHHIKKSFAAGNWSDH